MWIIICARPFCVHYLRLLSTSIPPPESLLTHLTHTTYHNTEYQQYFLSISLFLSACLRQKPSHGVCSTIQCKVCPARARESVVGLLEIVPNLRRENEC